jgi:flagellar motility protein MotE (MotC chaperone)
METTAQVQPTRVATMKYRKNSIEENDKEIEELEKARAGEEEKEEVEQEPEHPEERTFKKRYGDLRRHLQKKEDEHRKELLTIREQLSNLTKTQVRLPKTDEEIDEWANKYPDVAKVVETIATKKAREN